MTKWLIFAFTLVALCHPTYAQTINANSCSRSDVAAALAQVTQSTATVNIPAGHCQWSTNINFAAPSGVTSLTVQGQTTCTGSGDPTQSNLACTDGTVIQDNDTTDTQWLFNISGSGFVRITGLTIEKGTGATKNNAELALSAGNNARIDHNHFNSYTGGSSSDLVSVGGCTYGVADHNLWTNTTGNTGFSITPYNGEACNGATQSDGVWALPTGFGGPNFFFIEQNVFNNGSTAGSTQASDCLHGGKNVMRFNTLYNGAHFQTHPTGSSGPERGCRGTEIYQNNWIFTLGSGNLVNTIFFYSSGPALVWGNNAHQNGGMAGYASFVQLTDCRSPSGGSRCGYAEAPGGTGGWGYCGGSSPWDGNTNGTGYPCIDQPGRGESDMLGGSFQNNNRVDMSTGTAKWPHQKLEPFYYWLNAYTPLANGNGSLTPIMLDGNIWTQNQDYYVSSDQNSGTDCNGFTGATGIGCGPRSSRPATCTTGVAWWSTDQGSWNQSGNASGNGVLDICTSANSWTSASYTPYTYPHPLASNNGTPPPAAPTNLQVTVN